MDFATMEFINPWGDGWRVTALCEVGGWKVRMCSGEPQGGALSPDFQPWWGVRGRMVRSYLAGQLAGAQAVLHGERLGHVGHRLVELLQVALVLHLHGTQNPHMYKNLKKKKKKTVKWESTYLTSQRVGILQRLVNLTLLQVILWFLSFHLLVKLLLILHLFGLEMNEHMQNILKLE